MKRFFKVDIGIDGWGLLVNEGTAEEPHFRVVFRRSSEAEMERMAGDLNSGRSKAEARAGSSIRRHD